MTTINVERLKLRDRDVLTHRIRVMSKPDLFRTETPEERYECLCIFCASQLAFMLGHRETVLDYDAYISRNHAVIDELITEALGGNL